MKIHTKHTIYLGSDYEPEENGYGPFHEFDCIEGDTQLQLWDKFHRSLSHSQRETLMQIHEAKRKEDRRIAAITCGDELPLGLKREAI